nr:MAG TPA: major outer membrane lipoprotein [Caudoviricetes sp.]
MENSVQEKIRQLKNSFVQGEITEFTGNESNALMESDVERISNSINEALIDPVIDFVIACDDVLTETATDALNAAETARNLADVADRTAGQANSKAGDALTKAEHADKEAARAHTRLDGLNIPQIPNLDSQTWNWLPRSFDSVSIQLGNGVTLVDPVGGKPHITWTPIRQNFETGRYYIEGRFEARFKIMLMDWIQGSSGGHLTYLGGGQSLASFNGRIGLVNLSNDTMKPTNIQVNAYTAKDTQVIFGACADAAISTSKEVKLAIMADVGSDRFDRYADPVYVDLVMTFQRDGEGNFGFGNIFPELNP